MRDNKNSPIIQIESNIDKYNIKNINNKYEVINKVSSELYKKYLSNESQIKYITNIETGMKIEIWKNGIKETFGNDKYYFNLPKELKKAKIASMNSLAKLIKYAKVRSKDAKNYHKLNSRIVYTYLISEIKIDEKLYYVTIDIRKSPDGKNKFYIHNLSKKKGNNLSQLQSNWFSDKLLPKQSITSHLLDVNTNNIIFKM